MRDSVKQEIMSAVREALSEQLDDGTHQTLVDLTLERDGLRRSLEMVMKGQGNGLTKVFEMSRTSEGQREWSVETSIRTHKVIFDANPGIGGSPDQILEFSEKINQYVLTGKLPGDVEAEGPKEELKNPDE